MGWRADRPRRGLPAASAPFGPTGPVPIRGSDPVGALACDPSISGALRKLYRALVRVAPSLGAAVAVAAVDGEIDGPDAGLRALDSIDDPAAERFQPAWSTRAHLLAAAGREQAAAKAYRTAIELTTDEAVADYLREQLTSLSR